MVVYVDVLVFLNLFVNYFILQLTAKLCRDGYKQYRLILGALVGALFSLYIFLPHTGAFFETLFKLVISGVIVLTGFGFDSIKSLVRRIAVFFAASFLYAGFMLGIWAVLKPQNLAINNGIVYIDISPVVLILATVFCYAVLSLIRFFSQKHALHAGRCEITVTQLGRSITVNAIVDTGNSLSDAVTGRPVIVLERAAAQRLLLELPDIETVTAGGTVRTAERPGFRLLPYSSIGGHGLLPAFTPDSVTLRTKDGICPVERVLVAISSEPLGEDYKAILNPEIFDNVSGEIHTGKDRLQ